MDWPAAAVLITALVCLTVLLENLRSTSSGRIREINTLNETLRLATMNNDHDLLKITRERLAVLIGE